MRIFPGLAGHGARLAAAILPLLALSATTASAAEPVGAAKRIVRTVTGSGAVGNRGIGVEDPVYRDEAITAAASSRGELLLTDGSRIIVGENSTISLDRFVVAGNSFSSGTINVAKGAFRFISGGSGKEAIRIKTPLSTIGIRGTTVDVYVEPGTGITHAVLISGQITACADNGECQTTRRACDILRIPNRNQVEELPFLHSRARTQNEENQLFTLTGAANQGRFSPRWRAFEGGCFARAAEEARQALPPTNNGIPVPTPPTTPAPPDDPEPEPEPEPCGECGPD